MRWNQGSSAIVVLVYGLDTGVRLPAVVGIFSHRRNDTGSGAHRFYQI